MEIRIHKSQNTVLEFFCKLNTGKLDNRHTTNTYIKTTNLFLFAISKTVLHNKLRDDAMAQHYSEAFKAVLLTLRLIQGQGLLMLDPPS